MRADRYRKLAFCHYIFSCAHDIKQAHLPPFTCRLNCVYITCGNYLLLDRWSLLEKERHPLCSLHHHLVARLSHTDPTIAILHCNHPALPTVLIGYRSSLLLDPTHDEDVRMETEDAGELTGEEEPVPEMDGGDCRFTGKELKDLRNVEKASAGLKGLGVDGRVLGDPGSLASQTTDKSNFQSAGCGPGSKLSMRPFQHGMERDRGSSEMTPNTAADVLHPFISPVFVVHKMPPSLKPEGGENLESGLFEEATKIAEEPGIDAGCGENGDGMETDETASDTAAGITPMPHSSASVAEKKETLSSPQSPPVNTLFHLRCSLLENLIQLDCYLRVKSSKAVLMSGIVFRQCPISPFELPVSHETIILTKSENVADLANQLCAALRKVVGEKAAVTVKAKHSQNHFTLGDRSCINLALTLQVEGAQKFATLGEVFRFETSEGDKVGQQAEAPQQSPRTLIGAILYLDNITCLALGLPDVRLLWSEDDRFMGLFSGDSSPLSVVSPYRPFSLYPVRCVHDLSFWENPDCVFDEADFLDVVREVTDDVVTYVSLVDRFENADLGKTSRCYRLVFQSHDRAMSYITSWRLQSILRLKVAHRLGVLLR